MLPALIPLIVGPVLLLLLAAYAVRQHHVRGAGWYALLLLAIAAWSAAYAVELAAADTSTKITALEFKYLGVVLLPVAWMGFILDFVGRDRAQIRRVTRPMAGIAIGVLILAWTNRWHGLFWGPITTVTGPRFTLLVGRGPGFWANIVYTYCALWAGIGILIAQAIQSPFLYRARATVILTATLLPWIGNVVFLSRGEDMGGVDPTPFMFACTAVLAAVAVFRYRVLDPIPTLRDARIEVIGDGVIILDAGGRIADLNGAAERQIGRGRAEATGAPVADVLAGCPELSRRETRADVAMAGRHGERIYDVRATPIRGAGDQLAGHVLLLTDVTARRRAEAALADSEQRYRELVENARDLIVTCELDGRIVAINDAGLRITGYEREALLGTSLLALAAAESRAAAETPFAAAQGGGPPPPVEIVLLARDGHRVTFELASWLQHAGGAVRVQAIGRDISERRRLERDLRQAQKMEAVGKLAGGVAHDFNNLLTSIIGFATLAEDEAPPGSPARDWLAQIRRSGEHAAAVTRQLLAFGRRQMLRPVVLDLNRTIADLDGMLRRLVGEDIRLVTDLAEGLEPVRADVAQVEQVVVNLVVNARDAMPAGGEITIGTGVLTAGADTPLLVDLPPGRWVTLTVRDTGEGIPHEALGHIFEPFYTTKPSAHGAGLGLSTVYGIVKQSGGDVFVETSPGRGTTFTVFLPVASEAEGTDVDSARSDTPEATGTVLLVEDDAGVREFAEEVLRVAGLTVLAAPGPIEALHLAATQTPIDVLVTDVVLPHMSGGALADRLVALRPGLRVLFMSGYAEDDVMGRGGLAPGRLVLEKPFTPGELRRRVLRLLHAA